VVVRHVNKATRYKAKAKTLGGNTKALGGKPRPQAARPRLTMWSSKILPIRPRPRPIVSDWSGSL